MMTSDPELPPSKRGKFKNRELNLTKPDDPYDACDMFFASRLDPSIYPFIRLNKWISDQQIQKSSNYIAKIKHLLNEIACVKNYKFNFTNKQGELKETSETINEIKHKQYHRKDHHGISNLKVLDIEKGHIKELNPKRAEVANNIKHKWFWYMKQCGFPADSVFVDNNWWFYKMIRDQFVTNYYNTMNNQRLMKCAQLDRKRTLTMIQATNELYNLILSLAKDFPEIKQALKNPIIMNILSNIETFMEPYWEPKTKETGVVGKVRLKNSLPYMLFDYLEQKELAYEQREIENVKKKTHSKSN